MSLKKILPQIKPNAFLIENGEDVVSTDLFPDLKTCYVEDNESTMHYISGKRLQELGISIEELHETAIRNLRNLQNSKTGLNILDHDDGTRALTYETHDSYDAARILLLFSPDRLDYFIEVLGDPFYVAIPCRDFLLAAPKEFEGKLAAYAQQLYLEKENPLSSTIILFSKESRTFEN